MESDPVEKNTVLALHILGDEGVPVSLEQEVLPGNRRTIDDIIRRAGAPEGLLVHHEVVGLRRTRTFELFELGRSNIGEPGKEQINPTRDGEISINVQFVCVVAH